MKQRVSRVLMVIGIAMTLVAESCSTDTTLTPDTAAPERGLRRLSTREYNNAVRDLLGDDSAPANRFGLEVYTNGFDSGSKGLVVHGSELFAYRAAAEAIAALAVTNLPALVGGCDPARDAPACVASFLSGFAMRAYRRPLRAAEADRLRAVYAAGAADGGFRGGIQLMLEAVLQSPSFLYREEIGEPAPALPPGVVRLTAYEVASELSFFFTGSTPDATLLQAAAEGRLETPDDLAREATRLLALPAGRATFGAFLHQWLGTDHVDTLTKDANVYPTYGPALSASMSSELDAYFGSVYVGSGSLRELFTSTNASVDGNLASLYGLAAPTGAGASGFAPVQLDPTTRKGVLTRAGYLAAHADVDSSGPVPRGVYLLGEILCAPPPPPPPNIPLPTPRTEAAQSHITTRQRFDVHAGAPVCQGCHKRIDGIGFGFEEFDGIGAYRVTENGSAVDASGTILGTSTINGPFVGVSQLAERLATSPEVLTCYVRHVYRFGLGQDEPANDGDALVRSLGQSLDSDSRLTDTFVKLAIHPSFRLRSQQGN